ncbi:hypothetical protein RISK_002083 [Rhodopirellula islandica]|uniref:Uncharacterized protein n=1 Tax=Rhodopirellula islandica TaxID=595434 RepID=A0A0J1BFY2_RHOIS|nr:hypothetical protein RISK_002083 [Rhodopirellula islandica]
MAVGIRWPLGSGGLVEPSDLPPSATQIPADWRCHSEAAV